MRRRGIGEEEEDAAARIEEGEEETKKKKKRTHLASTRGREGAVHVARGTTMARAPCAALPPLPPAWIPFQLTGEE